MGLDLPKVPNSFLRTDVRDVPAGGITQTNFNTDDFLVTSGIAALKNKTSFWSCSGSNFTAPLPAADTWGYGTNDNAINASDLTGDAVMNASVSLPQGAVITGVIVYGSNATKTWRLRRVTLSGGANSELATANVNTEDTTITNPTIDNSLYTYFLQAEETGHNVFGGRITYTTDYD